MNGAKEGKFEDRTAGNAGCHRVVSTVLERPGRPDALGTKMTAQDLQDLYYSWTGKLHFYLVKELGRHADVEYFPNQYVFRIYSGHLESILGTVRFGRPEGERSATVQVPRPEQNPSQAELDEAFRALCVAAARVLEIDVGKKRLSAENAPQSLPGKKHAFLPDRRRRAKKRSNRGH